MSVPFDFAQLARFIAIVEFGSFRAAGEALGLTQPTLSWSIRQLETAVGATLFERVARGAKLSPAGEILLPRARMIINEGERAHHDLNVFTRKTDAFIAIGIAPMFINHIFPNAVAATLARAPGLKIRVTEAYSPDLVKGLQSGKMDIAFGGEPPEAAVDGIAFEPTYRGRFLVVARRGHPIFRKKITEDVVLKQDFVIFDAPSAGLPQSDFPPRTSKRPHVIVRASSMQCIKALVMHSDLLGNVGFDYVRTSLEAGDLREVPTKLMGRVARAGILTRKGGAQTQAMRVLKEELTRACSSSVSARSE